MFKKLFRRPASKRTVNVETLSVDADTARLRQLVQGGDPPTAAQALQKLQDVDLAVSHWQAEATPVREAAQGVVRAALNRDALAPGEPFAGQTQAVTLDVLRQLDPTMAERWLQSLPEADCLDLALTASAAPTRQMAAEKLETIDTLHRLQRAAKGHDNTLYRLAKSRLQNLRAAETALRERNESLDHVRESLQKLANSTYDPLLEGRLQHLLSCFSALQPSAEEQALVEPLKQEVERRIVEQKAARREAEAVSTAQPDSAPAVTETPQEPEWPTEPAATATADGSEPTATQQPGSAEAAEESHEPETARQAPTRPDIPDSEREAVRAVRGLVRRGRGAVNAGHLRQARGIWGSIESHLGNLPESRHAGVCNEARDYQQEMEQLADWQDFAVVPKKEELIEHMKALGERTMHPQDKADAVQQLQQKWRTLSQGGGGRHQELWETFHHWAEKAYEPCRAYFAEQDELHAANLVKRRELIDQLHQYLETNDWHNPDWAEVEKVLRLAARDWRHFTPVKPADHRTTEKAYQAAVDRIREQLHKEYDRNQAERERIIQSAEALRDQDDLRHATEQLKQLQREWKAAGRTYRKEDHRLWQAFRTICDDVFGRRDEAAKEHKENLEANLAAAMAIVHEVEAAADGSADAIQTGLSRLDQWRSDFDACKPLPRARSAEAQEQFDQAVGALKQARQRRRRRQEKEKWHALFERVKCLGELEARYWAGSPDPALCKQVARVWEDGTPLPAVASHVDSRLKASLARCGTKAGEPVADNGQTLRRLVVRMELMAEVDSPEVDRELRLAIQVDRLADQMGGSRGSDDADPVLREWLQTPVATDEAEFMALQDRFEKAWETCNFS